MAVGARPYGTCTGQDGLEATAARQPNGQVQQLRFDTCLGGAEKTNDKKKQIVFEVVVSKSIHVLFYLET